MAYKPRFFRLEELLDSSTARKLSQQNSPTWEVVENLSRLCVWLDDMRLAWGSGIKCTSGFRSASVNSAVGGVRNSAHLYGNGADLYPVNGDFDGFVKFLKRWLPTYERSWDECIIESKKGSRCVHFSNYYVTGGQRRKLFEMTVKP